MDLPLDQERMPQLISAGTTVEPIKEFTQGSNVPPAERAQARDKQTGQPLWRIFVFLAGEDGARPEMIPLKIAAPVEPRPGPFGSLLELEGLTAVPYVDNAGRVAISYKATGIMPPVIARAVEKAS
jgi:hypothetical protein